MSDRQNISRSHLILFILAFGLVGIVLWQTKAAPNPNLQGDLNGDNTVDASDLSILLSDFGTNKAEADINGDGTVDVEDLSALLSHYGQSYTGGGGYTPTYYVSNEGSDSNNGTSPSTPWKTVAKVQSTCFKPGDVIAFEGGESFTDTYLDTNCSGTASQPIVFTSYGTGRAIFNQAWMSCGQHDFTFDNLELTNNNTSQTILFASGGTCSGNPVYDITLQNSYLHDTQGEALQSNTNDHDWLIQNNTFQHTGDSGLILYYSTNITVTKNTITDTGWNTNIAYGKHGIYSKSPNTTISYNDFSDNQNGQSISIRTHGQSIYGNTIHDTGYAIAFFDYDTTAPPQGTTYIYYNRLWNITGYAFYYDNQADPNGNAPTVNFVIANNTFVESSSSAEMFNLSVVPSGASVTTANNIFTGAFGSAYRGCATCTEKYDDWFGGTSNPASGAGDVFADPKLNAAPGLSLQSGSPAVNAGTANIPGLTYSVSSDGAPLHYQGGAPDLGAVESSY